MSIALKLCSIIINAWPQFLKTLIRLLGAIDITIRILLLTVIAIQVYLLQWTFGPFQKTVW